MATLNKIDEKKSGIYDNVVCTSSKEKKFVPTDHQKNTL